MNISEIENGKLYAYDNIGFIFVFKCEDIMSYIKTEHFCVKKEKSDMMATQDFILKQLLCKLFHVGVQYYLVINPYPNLGILKECSNLTYYFTQVYAEMEPIELHSFYEVTDYKAYHFTRRNPDFSLQDLLFNAIDQSYQSCVGGLLLRFVEPEPIIRQEFIFEGKTIQDSKKPYGTNRDSNAQLKMPEDIKGFNM